MRKHRLFGKPKIPFSALTQIRECTTIEALTAAIDKALSHLNIEHWMYTAQLDLSPARHELFVIDRLPKGIRHKLLASCEMNDPTFNYAKHHSIAVLWAELASTAFIGVDSGMVSRFLVRAHAAGLEKCLSVPVHGLGPVCAMMTLTLRDPKHPLGKWATNAEATLLAMYVHQTAMTLLEKRVIYPSLTAREVECLRWAAEGRSAPDIAALLDITERTVFFHHTNACLKLHVSTRQQAIAQALVLGLLRSENEVSNLRLIPPNKTSNIIKRGQRSREKKPVLKTLLQKVK